MLIIVLCLNAGILGVIAVLLVRLVQETARVHRALDTYSAAVQDWTQMLANLRRDAPRQEEK